MGSKNTDELPDYKEKQKLLYVKDTPPEVLLKIAEMLLEEDHFNEAYDYILRSGDEGRLEKYMHLSLERGDFFNFERAVLKLDLEIPVEMWEQLAEKALAQDMIVNAVEAYRRAGRRDEADKIARKHTDFFGPIFEMERVKGERVAEAGELDGAPEKISSSGAAEATPESKPELGTGAAKKKKKKRRKRR